MDDDDTENYELAELLEDIERIVRTESSDAGMMAIGSLLRRARLKGIIRYPVPS